ncbi:hypothetical protein [Glaciihabitans sp. dw_435]|uniref:hypothetical protein n=1 Tax=Glaciihabitans sp. dw_435 TaxID=2720081 RepID=UPI001BD2292E|nr:hypothetical protein [Glaciihabitans sp. dw_435]
MSQSHARRFERTFVPAPKTPEVPAQEIDHTVITRVSALGEPFNDRFGDGRRTSSMRDGDGDSRQRGLGIYGSPDRRFEAR